MTKHQLLGALVGFFLGLVSYFLGVLIVRLFRVKNPDKSAAWIGLISTAFLIRTDLIKTVDQWIFPPSLYFQLSKKIGFEEVLNSEQVMIIIKNKKLSLKEASMILTRSGLKRLDFDQLFRLNKIKTEMAKKNREVCIGFWTGNLSENLFISVLEDLGETKILEFLNIVKSSAQMELQQSPIRILDSANLENAFKTIANRYPSTFERFANNLKTVAPIKPEDGCWTFLEMSKYISELNPNESEALLRLMASD